MTIESATVIYYAWSSINLVALASGAIGITLMVLAFVLDVFGKDKYGARLYFTGLKLGLPMVIVQITMLLDFNSGYFPLL